MLTVKMRAALVSERGFLEALQWRASLKNPGDRDALLRNRDAIQLPLEQITGGGVFVAEVVETVVAFAAILSRDDGDTEVDALFVEPELWQRGIGRSLVEHCCSVAKAAGAKSLHVIGNPQAEAFYDSCGFTRFGTKATRFGVGLLMKRNV
jgi:N-acetylglutamate synthase-like GNAT family acetyltransferase